MTKKSKHQTNIMIISPLQMHAAKYSHSKNYFLEKVAKIPTKI